MAVWRVRAPSEGAARNRMGEPEEIQAPRRVEETKRAYQRPEIVELGEVRDVLKGAKVKMASAE